jgi:thiosulfate/3-mercaptopyruvate sulfurtransferase
MIRQFATVINVQELASLMDNGELTLFDCSFDLANPDAGQQAFVCGHVPGASYLHLDQDLSSPPSGNNGRHPLPQAEVLAAKLRACGLRNHHQVVVYDRSGGAFAARLWWLLRWLGHDAVALLDGGWNAWIAAGQGEETGVAHIAQPGDFTPHPRSNMTVSVDDLLASPGDGRYRVVDARSPERFRGEPNPLDPVAGHIPGARNRFFQHNLDEHGMWKSPEMLRKELVAAIGETEGKQVVLQCGSGVTACHNAFAMTLAGWTDYRLYPGSWSEWICDPARPVDRGA